MNPGVPAPADLASPPPGSSAWAPVRLWLPIPVHPGDCKRVSFSHRGKALQGPPGESPPQGPFHHAGHRAAGNLPSPTLRGGRSVKSSPRKAGEPPGCSAGSPGRAEWAAGGRDSSIPSSWIHNVRSVKWGSRRPSPRPLPSPVALSSILRAPRLSRSRGPGLPTSAGRPGTLSPAPSPLTQHDGAEPPGQALGQVVHVELHRIEIRRLHRDPWRRRPRSPSGTRQRLGPSRTRRGWGAEGAGRGPSPGPA